MELKDIPEGTPAPCHQPEFIALISALCVPERFDEFGERYDTMIDEILGGFPQDHSLVMFVHRNRKKNIRYNGGWSERDGIEVTHWGIPDDKLDDSEALYPVAAYFVVLDENGQTGEICDLVTEEAIASLKAPAGH